VPVKIGRPGDGRILPPISTAATYFEDDGDEEDDTLVNEGAYSASGTLAAKRGADIEHESSYY